MRPIADLHCDLLCYLAKDVSRSVMNREVRCSLPQLKEGNVKIQAMAVFTETKKGSTLDGKSQIEQFSQLAFKYPNEFKIVTKNSPLTSVKQSDPMQIILAIENASGVFEEDEPLEEGFRRIEEIERTTGKILYLSMTWNLHNRFGGGAHTKEGIKEDGLVLLDYMHQKQIAIDLSHTSDALAHDILNYIARKDLKIPVIASHSNFRTVCNVPRNLPDEIAQEIINKQGFIGLVLYREFVGKENALNIVEQMNHLMKLKGEKQICFGADFFFGLDLPPSFQKPSDQLFFPEYPHAGFYPYILDLWKTHLDLSEEMLNGIAYQNFLNFYRAHIEAPQMSNQGLSKA